MSLAVSIRAALGHGEDAQDKPAGVSFVSGEWCWYPPAVTTADVLQVDFGRRDPRRYGDGLYVVGFDEGPLAAWRGCRRIAIALTGNLQVDDSGSGDWRELNLETTGLRIVGQVLEVYKPSMRA